MKLRLVRLLIFCLRTIICICLDVHKHEASVTETFFFFFFMQNLVFLR